MHFVRRPLATMILGTIVLGSIVAGSVFAATKQQLVSDTDTAAPYGSTLVADTQTSPTTPGIATTFTTTIALSTEPAITQVSVPESTLTQRTALRAARRMSARTSATTQLLELLKNGKDGQVLTLKDGKPIWTDFLKAAAPAEPTRTQPPALRRYSDYSEVTTVSRRSGGSPVRENEDGVIEGHTHTSAGGGNVLDILGATQGTLTVSRGGTGKASYSTGDLLVGDSLGGLVPLSIGTNGEVLTVSSGTAVWATASSLISVPSDNRYVNQSGDTMTGALVINLTNGNLNSLGLRVLQTLSGAHLHAESRLSSSGALIVAGNATFDTNTLFVDAANDRVGIGTTSPSYKLEVNGSTKLITTEIGTAPVGTFFGLLNIGGTVAINQAQIHVANSGGSPVGGINSTGGMFATNTLYFLQSTGGETGTIQVGSNGRNSGDFYGNPLTLQSGGAKASSTNQVAGDLILSTGISTGAGTSKIVFKTAPVGSSGTSDNTPVEVMRIQSSGNVGIGITSPETKLEVVGTISGSLITQNGAGSNYFMGNVGIGSTTASYSLDVLNNIGLGARFRSAGGSTVYIESSAGGISALGLGSNIDNDIGSISYNTSTNALTFQTNNSVQLTVLSSGNVGIGTTTPSERFHVSGGRALVSHNSSLAFIVEQAGGTDIFTVNTVTPAISVAGNVILPSGGNNWFGADSQNAMVFDSSFNTILNAITGVYINLDANNTGATGDFVIASNRDGITGGSEHFRILEGNGNVGIGTTSPTERLSISGAILIDSDETVSTNNAFKIITNVTSSNNTVFRVSASGAVYADGQYNSAGADYAEWFRVGGEEWQKGQKRLEAGDLVCIDVIQNNTVRKCTRPGDPNLMGIVSTNPSFVGNSIGGADGIIPPGYVLVGLIGQVPAKVMVESGAIIRPGDALTSASVPGYARKAKAGESTVGVALEGFDGSTTLTTGGSGLTTNHYPLATINVLISRRNQSLTVETVEQKVLDSIASMNLSDEIRQMVQSVSQNLNLEDKVTTALNSRLQSIDLSEQINQAITRRLSGALVTASNLTQTQITLIASTLRSLTQTGTTTAYADALSARMLRLETALSGSLLLRETPPRVVSTTTMATFGSGITVLGRSTLGSLTISGSSIQIGSLMSSGSLVVMGNITISGLAEFLGDVHIKGELVLSNRQAGFAVIPKTGTSVTLSWDPPMVSTPVVTATPNVPVLFAVTKTSATGFTIRIAGTAEEGITFSYIALSAEQPQITNGHAAAPESVLTPFPVNALGQPVSSDAVWNGCIQGRPVLDSDGQPFSCSRYHDDAVWEHPDLKISFTYRPNNDPPLLLLPEGFTATVTPTPNPSPVPVEGDAASGESSVSSSESSSASSESSVSSSASSVPPPLTPPPTGEGNTEGSSAPAEVPAPLESADPAPAPTEEDSTPHASRPFDKAQGRLNLRSSSA